MNHSTVEIIDNENGEVEYAYLYEHTHPLNEVEAWWKFGHLCMAQSEEDGVLGAVASFPRNPLYRPSEN